MVSVIRHLLPRTAELFCDQNFVFRGTGNSQIPENPLA